MPERRAQPHRLVAVHVRHEAVDVAHRQAGVGDRVADGDARELELALGRLAALVVRGLADPDDDRGAVHYSAVHYREKTRTALAPRILALDSSARPPI